MKIAVASDHRGVNSKEKVKQILSRLGYEVRDFGTNGAESVDYPDYGLPAARAVAQGECDRGILICGSGIGMCMVANKVHGIRAALCHNETTARLSRQHNNANVLCVGADVLGEQEMAKIVSVWLDTPFEGGRHERRVAKIMDEERK